MIDKSGDGRITKEEWLRPAQRSVEHWDGDRDSVLKWYEKLFDKADLDENGYLDEDETVYLLELVVESLRLARPGTQQFVAADGIGTPSTESIFDVSDIDGDGFLDEEEFAKFVAGKAMALGWGEYDGDVAAWGRDVFERSEMNGDDALNPNEFHFATYVISEDITAGKFTERRFVAQMFRAMDANRDDKITEEEATVAIARDHLSDDPATKERAELFDGVWKHAPKFDANRDGALDREEMKAFSDELLNIFATLM